MFESCRAHHSSFQRLTNAMVQTVASGGDLILTFALPAR